MCCWTSLVVHYPYCKCSLFPTITVSIFSIAIAHYYMMPNECKDIDVLVRLKFGRKLAKEINFLKLPLVTKFCKL